MRLRTARKIIAAVGTSRAAAYSSRQIGEAGDRVERTASARADNAYWDALMRSLGAIGRAKLMKGWGDTAGAFDLLMRTPVSESSFLRRFYPW